MGDRRPHPPVAPTPLAVSQLTSLEVLGVDARRYLELLARHPEVPRACVGRLRLVAVDDARALLTRLAAAAPRDGDDGDDDEPTTVDAVLAAVGHRRTA